MYILNDFLFSITANDINVLYDSSEKTNHHVINPSLQEYLFNIKTEIDKYQDKWDEYKKLTNKYEFINTCIFMDKIKQNSCVCSYKPISRSYFKMIEILNHFRFEFPSKINSFHLAEGPGGFIEALQMFRSNVNDKYVGMTLIEPQSDIPKWNKIQQFMKSNKNIRIESGPKHDGNLYFKHNLLYLMKTQKNKYDFITADGGFDYSIDFNKQEELSINLIFCEMLYALVLQKPGGSFVLKIFDIFYETTTEILYLLSYFYKQVFVYKPNTSREANSEKYIICKGFIIGENYNSIVQKLIENFHDLSKQKIHKIFNFDLNSYFLSKIQEINAIYGQQQVENILNTINSIQDDNCNHKDKLIKIKQTNIERCIKWCKKNNQPVYSMIIQQYAYT